MSNLSVFCLLLCARTRLEVELHLTFLAWCPHATKKSVARARKATAMENCLKSVSDSHLMAHDLCLMTEHSYSIVRWKGQLGANPNPPCQHSLWKETGVAGEPTTFGRALIDSFHASALSPQRELNPRSQR